MISARNVLLSVLGSLVLSTGLAHADLVETKLKVTGRYYDGAGNTKKLVKTRAFIQYDDEATVLDQAKNSDCLVSAGKEDLLSLWSDADSKRCVSTKNYIVTSEEAIQEILYRPTEFQLLGKPNLLDTLTKMIQDGASLTNQTSNDKTDGLGVRAILRNTIGTLTKLHTISLVGPTTFRLQGSTAEKFVITLEPVSTRKL
ncbi:MAG: hypothetical protein JST04_08745 [Bdellovibrionales bacterium]|nr:hypothetical protein [Bdellovibrionales bacterium]